MKRNLSRWLFGLEAGMYDFDTGWVMGRRATMMAMMAMIEKKIHNLINMINLITYYQGHQGHQGYITFCKSGCNHDFFHGRESKKFPS